MITLVPATPAHVGRIASGMREADRIEVAAFGRTAKEALRLGLRGSVLAFTACRDRQPIAMLGLTPVNAIEGVGRPWMLGTDAVFDCAKQLIAGAPPLLAAMHARFRRLENEVWTGNVRAIRMLKRWGFEFGEDVTVIRGRPFVQFWRDAGV